MNLAFALDSTRKCARSHVYEHSTQQPFGRVPLPLWRRRHRNHRGAFHSRGRDRSKAVTAKTRIWVDGVGETIIDMDYKGDGFFSASIECDKPQLKWYSFIVSTQDGYTATWERPWAQRAERRSLTTTPMSPRFKLPSTSTVQPGRLGMKRAWFTRSFPIGTAAMLIGASAL